MIRGRGTLVRHEHVAQGNGIIPAVVCTSPNLAHKSSKLQLQFRRRYQLDQLENEAQNPPVTSALVIDFRAGCLLLCKPEWWLACQPQLWPASSTLGSHGRRHLGSKSTRPCYSKNTKEHRQLSSGLQ